MDAFLNEMLGGPGNKDARERFRSLWDVRGPKTIPGEKPADIKQEYEARETPESKLVKVRDGPPKSLGQDAHPTGLGQSGACPTSG